MIAGDLHVHTLFNVTGAATVAPSGDLGSLVIYIYNRATGEWFEVEGPVTPDLLEGLWGGAGVTSPGAWGGYMHMVWLVDDQFRSQTAARGPWRGAAWSLKHELWCDEAVVDDDHYVGLAGRSVAVCRARQLLASRAGDTYTGGVSIAVPDVFRDITPLLDDFPQLVYARMMWVAQVACGGVVGPPSPPSASCSSNDVGGGSRGLCPRSGGSRGLCPRSGGSRGLCPRSGGSRGLRDPNTPCSKPGRSPIA